MTGQYMSVGRRWAIVVAVVGLALLVGAVVAVLAPTPIREQSCEELAVTEQRIVNETDDRSRSVDEQRQTMQDAAEVDDRVNRLGGCPQTILR